MIYCIYTDRNISEEEANSEHIIPLSLGGVNGFEIPVERNYNATAGSKIDGALANDFLTLFARREHDTSGHSGKSPFPLAKKSKIVKSNKPVQVAFEKEDIKVYSPIEKRYLTTHEKVGETFKSTFQVNPDSNLKFSAKVALSAGYFIYGDLFREKVAHDDLRLLMNFDRKTANRNEFRNIRIKGWFWPHPVEEKDKKDFALYDYFAKTLNCSFVLCIPGPKNIGFIIALLGRLVGILNVAAKTDNFPNTIEHDLDHAVILQNKKVIRCSYRALVGEYMEKFNDTKKS